jgi:ABC-type polysaccharide/polyol phosphate export permease
LSLVNAWVPGWPAWWASAKVHGRVVGALVLREVITRYGRSGLGSLWLVLEPMIFTLVLTALWTAIRLDTVSELPIVAFSITGWMSFLMWRNAASRCLNAIEANEALYYHRNVRVLDIFTSRIVLEIMGSTAAFALLMGLLNLLEFIAWPADWLTVLLAWFYLCWFALCLGFLVGALSHLSENFSMFWRIISIALMIMSGKFFMVHWLPPTAQEVVLWLPMVHGLEMLRQGYWGDLVPTYHDVGYMIKANLVLMLMGLSLQKLAERKVDE